MLTIEVDVSQIAGAEAAFRQVPARLKKHMKTAMQDSLYEVLKHGMDRVHVITGTLRRSITATRPIENTGGGYDGKVGTNLVYAKMEEYGYSGPQNVRSHTRTRAFGRETRPYIVGAFTRNINRPEHPYLRPALAESRDAIIRFHQQAVADTVAEMGGAA